MYPLSIRTASLVLSVMPWRTDVVMVPNKIEQTFSEGERHYLSVRSEGFLFADRITSHMHSYTQKHYVRTRRKS